MTSGNSVADIAIIGAGAAGLAAAIFAGERAEEKRLNLSIVLIDGAKKPGAKILVSGGGRCNVTNEKVTPDDYCGGSSKIIRNVLLRFDEQQTVAWMQSLGVDLKREPAGKLFPVTDTARTVLDALMGRVDDLGIHKLFGWRVRNIRQEPSTAGSPALWTLANSDGTTLQARKIILATGGRALPKSGSDGASYAWLQAMGHSIIPTVPALAPLLLDERGITDSPLSSGFAGLSGLSLDARLEFVADGRALATFTGPLLFTHFGLSGPMAMNISRFVAVHRLTHPVGSASDAGHLRLGLPQFADTREADTWLLAQIASRPKASVVTILKELMPERMAATLAHGVDSQRLSDLSKNQRTSLARLLAGSPLAVKGDRGYSFGEATAGGVSLDEISWKSMRSRKADNLYLCGEVLDVDGRIGGFNFQWAWSTGYIAGRAAADSFLNESPEI